MRIIPITFGCNRDMPLADMMAESVKKITTERPYIYVDTDFIGDTPNFIKMQRPIGWGNGAGWEASMMKVGAILEVIEREKLTDEDYILSIDSDVMILEDFFIEKADIMGFQHSDFYDTKLGKWGHLSGCCIFLKVGIAKRICLLDKYELAEIRHNEFKAFNICENEDVVLSYLAVRCGAILHAFPYSYLCNDIENYFKGIRDHAHKLIHFNIEIKEFLGQPVNGKWDIPKIVNFVKQ